MTRWMNAACALLFAGCAPKALPPLAYSPPEPLPSPLAATEVWENCLKQEIEPLVAAVWAERAARGEYPDLPTTKGTNALEIVQSAAMAAYQGTDAESKVLAAALNKCLPSRHPWSGYVRKTFPGMEAARIYDEAENKYLKQIQDIHREREAKKTAENQARLKQEEPAIARRWRDCIFTNAERLALASEELAEVIVSASYAACGQEREAILELHRRYEDHNLDVDMMEAIERRLAPDLTLAVIRARAAKHGPPPAQAPPAPSPPPAPEERSI